MKILVRAFLLIGLLTAGTLAQAQITDDKKDANLEEARHNPVFNDHTKNTTEAEVVAEGMGCTTCAKNTSPATMTSKTNPVTGTSTETPVETKAGADSSGK